MLPAMLSPSISSPGTFAQLGDGHSDTGDVWALLCNEALIVKSDAQEFVATLGCIWLPFDADGLTWLMQRHDFTR